MAKVIDFYLEKKKLDEVSKQKELELIDSSPELQTFLDYCKEWKRKKAELCREDFILVKGKGEIL